MKRVTSTTMISSDTASPLLREWMHLAPAAVSSVKVSANIDLPKCLNGPWISFCGMPCKGLYLLWQQSYKISNAWTVVIWPSRKSCCSPPQRMFAWNRKSSTVNKSEVNLISIDKSKSDDKRQMREVFGLDHKNCGCVSRLNERSTRKTITAITSFVQQVSCSSRFHCNHG